MSSRGMPVTASIRAGRRAAAEDRQKEYDKLTIQQKLDKLPPEPRAAKQRKKLLVLLNKPAAPAVVKETSAPAESEIHLKAKDRRAKERKER